MTCPQCTADISDDQCTCSQCGHGFGQELDSPLLRPNQCIFVFKGSVDEMYVDRMREG
jgi:hypothetical protein